MATLTPAQLAAINSISDEDLAPPPSSDDIFGHMEELKNQFAEDNQKIADQMAENEVTLRIETSLTEIFLQARVKSNMAAKLAERRQRRARVNLEERESAALTNDTKEDHEEPNHDDHEEEEHHEKKHKDKKHKDKKHKDKKHKKHKDKSDD